MTDVAYRRCSGHDAPHPRPFTRQQGLAAGITLRELRGPRYQRLHTGTFVSGASEVTPLVRAAALLPFGEKAFASHATAARVWELPIPTLPEEHVTVVVKSERRRRADIVCHYAANGWIHTIDGVRVSAIEQTVVELATLLSSCSRGSPSPRSASLSGTTRA